MVTFCVTVTSAIFEPRTSATATTYFAGFIDGAASGTYENGDRRRVCGDVCWCGIGEDTKGTTLSNQLLFGLNEYI